MRIRTSPDNSWFRPLTKKCYQYSPNTYEDEACRRKDKTRYMFTRLNPLVRHRISPNQNNCTGAATNSIVSEQMSQNHAKMYFVHLLLDMWLSFDVSGTAGLPKRSKHVQELGRTFSEVPETRYTFLSSIGRPPSLWASSTCGSGGS
jgi:hypothetical protein